MYRCMVTPDGYMVGVDGAWTGQMMSLESGMDSDRAEAYENILLSAQKLEDYTLFDLDKDARRSFLSEREPAKPTIHGTCTPITEAGQWLREAFTAAMAAFVWTAKAISIRNGRIWAFMDCRR